MTILLGDKNFSLSKHLVHLYKTYGFKGYYKGLSLTFVKVIPYNGIMFSLNEQLRKIFNYH